MRILGIDPGYAILGYGVVESFRDGYELVECGAVRTDKSMAMPARLKTIYSDLMDIISDTEPEAAAIEELFWGTNTTTAIGVGEARGAAIVACANCGLRIYEYTPLQIKMALTGYGRAEKEQMQEIVRSLLGLETPPKPDDVADALAAAICHANSADSIERIAKYTGGV
ncbi:MAG: crossover junction endodeoxyribonuclease RuvC [Clostridiales Family XIII bacterium]|jgi:crossover junction endodeoxyribonuclease RuvC|nr:crossover junction endodeoxyribonuclease RuvC [Clostridiales Family XIII bacterium]